MYSGGKTFSIDHIGTGYAERRDRDDILDRSRKSGCSTSLAGQKRKSGFPDRRTRFLEEK